MKCDMTIKSSCESVDDINATMAELEKELNEISSSSDDEGEQQRSESNKNSNVELKISQSSKFKKVVKLEGSEEEAIYRK